MVSENSKTSIRANFDLEPFDETLGAGKVTECKATYKPTGDIIQLEAKTRNVKNVLGATEGKATKIRLYDKLRDAIEKDVQQPYIIFVDLNFPELNVYAENEKINKIREEHDKLIEQHPNNLPNAIIYTNIPFHYARNNKDVANTAYGFIKISKPKFELKNENVILDAIHQALNQYQYLPREFNENEKFAQSVIDMMRKNKPKDSI